MRLPGFWHDWAYRGAERWEPDRLRSFQLHRLRTVAAFAAERVPYYRELFRRHGIAPQDLRTEEDFERIPPSGKADLRKAYPVGLLAEGLDSAAAKPNFTSGSTGEPFQFFTDLTASRFHANTGPRIFRWWGARPWHRMAYLRPLALGTIEQVQRERWGGRLSRILKGYPVRQLDLSAWAPPSVQLSVLARFRPELLIGFANSLVALAEEAERSGASLGTRVVFTTAEVLTEAARESIRLGLQAAVCRIYGSREFGEIAGECPALRGFHVNADQYYVEVVRDGRRVPPGTPGEILVTDLRALAMPFLRYRIGDLGSLALEACPCGRTLPRITDIAGRTADAIRGPDGEAIPPQFFWNPWREIPGLRQAQLVQIGARAFRIRIVRGPEFQEGAIAGLEAFYRKRLGDALTLEVEYVESIEREPSGKYRMVRALPPEKEGTP